MAGEHVVTLWVFTIPQLRRSELGTHFYGVDLLQQSGTIVVGILRTHTGLTHQSRKETCQTCEASSGSLTCSIPLWLSIGAPSCQNAKWGHDYLSPVWSAALISSLYSLVRTLRGASLWCQDAFPRSAPLALPLITAKGSQEAIARFSLSQPP